MEELEAAYEYMELHPEVRPAVAKVKQPVVDEDGYVTHHEVRELVCAVHTLPVGLFGEHISRTRAPDRKCLSRSLRSKV